MYNSSSWPGVVYCEGYQPRSLLVIRLNVAEAGKHYFVLLTDVFGCKKFLLGTDAHDEYLADFFQVAVSLTCHDLGSGLCHDYGHMYYRDSSSLYVYAWNRYMYIRKLCKTLPSSIYRVG